MAEAYFQSARYGPNSVTKFTSAMRDFPVVKSGVWIVEFAMLKRFLMMCIWMYGENEMVSMDFIAR